MLDVYWPGSFRKTLELLYLLPSAGFTQLTGHLEQPPEILRVVTFTIQLRVDIRRPGHLEKDLKP